MANAGFLGDVNEAQLSRLGQHVAKQPNPAFLLDAGGNSSALPVFSGLPWIEIHIEIAVVVVVEVGRPRSP